MQAANSVHIVTFRIAVLLLLASLTSALSVSGSTSGLPLQLDLRLPTSNNRDLGLYSDNLDDIQADEDLASRFLAFLNPDVTGIRH